MKWTNKENAYANTVGANDHVDLNGDAVLEGNLSSFAVYLRRTMGKNELSRWTLSLLHESGLFQNGVKVLTVEHAITHGQDRAGDLEIESTY